MQGLHLLPVAQGLTARQAQDYTSRRSGGRTAAGFVFKPRGKSGLRESRMPGNARPEQSEGKCHRKQTALS